MSAAVEVKTAAWINKKEIDRYASEYNQAGFDSYFILSCLSQRWFDDLAKRTGRKSINHISWVEGDESILEILKGIASLPVPAEEKHYIEYFADLIENKLLSYRILSLDEFSRELIRKKAMDPFQKITKAMKWDIDHCSIGKDGCIYFAGNSQWPFRIKPSGLFYVQWLGTFADSKNQKKQFIDALRQSPEIRRQLVRSSFYIQNLSDEDIELIRNAVAVLK
jgi:hypothetical protein